MRPERTQRGRKILLSLGSLLVGLAVAEGAARLFLERPQSVRVSRSANHVARLRDENRNPAEMTLQRGPGQGLYVETTTGTRLRANTVAVIENHRLSKRDIVVRTNSLGYRNPALGEKTRPRVLFLGDSITFGDYVDEEQTFVRLVEAISLETAAPLEAVNAGIGHIGIENELAVLMETGLDIDPDVVVLGFYLNDVSNSPGVEVLRVPRALAWSRLLQQLAHALPNLLSREDEETPIRVRRAWMEEVAERFPPGEGDPLRDPAAFNRRIQETFLDWGSAWSEAAWERIEPVLVEFKRQADLHGFQLVIICFPVRAQVEAEFVRDHPQQRLAQVAGQLSIPLLDLLPLLREASPSSSEPMFYDQCHHTPYGNRLIAEWVHEFLREQTRL